MSPSADQLEKTIEGRKLVQGDVLVTEERTSDTVLTSLRLYFEVVVPLVPNTEFYRPLRKVTTDGIELKELTPHGPVYKTRIFRRDADLWSNIVRLEDRTDKPSLKER